MSYTTGPKGEIVIVRRAFDQARRSEKLLKLCVPPEAKTLAAPFFSPSVRKFQVLGNSYIFTAKLIYIVQVRNVFELLTRRFPRSVCKVSLPGRLLASMLHVCT